MRSFLTALLVASMLLGIETLASAHGGEYRGPVGEVPPGQRDPKDPQPPPQNPGPQTPPRGGPGTENPGGTPTGNGGTGGSPKPRQPGPGSGPTAPTGGAGTKTPRGKSRVPQPMSFDNWLFWWHYNKDEFLNLKVAVRRRGERVATGSSTNHFGGSWDGNRKRPRRPTQAMVQKQVVPALMKVIADKSIHPDIRGGALIALARCGARLESAKIFFQVANPASSEHNIVRESAILALGIMQLAKPEVRNYLIRFLDNPENRFRSRCFAALSLGLLRDHTDEAFAALERCLSGRERTPDVEVCALLAIGLSGDESRVPILVRWLEKGRIGPEKLNDLRRAYLVAALGKIGDPAALASIVPILRKGNRPYSRRSAVIALGQILPQADDRAQLDYVGKLAQYLSVESDQTARNFGLIALGRIGGMEGASEPVRSACVRVLTRAFEKGNRSTERPFAALALGIVGFDAGGESKKSEDLKYRLAALIRDDLSMLRGDPAALGAQAIALGLIGRNDAETIDLLSELVRDSGLERKLRGASAVALGLIGDRRAKGVILSALREREDRDLRVDTAIAAGLLGDADAVRLLVATVRDQKASQFVLGSVALSLGQIGDREAIPALLGVLESDKTDGAFPDLTRALVTVALGQIADQRDFRVLFRISKDMNYRASVAAVVEVLTIL